MSDRAVQLEPWQRAWLGSRDNPWLFATGVLGFAPSGTEPAPDQPVLEQWQDDFLREFHTSSRHSIRSGHGTGKGTVLAILALWFPLTHYDSKSVLTANSQDQLRDNNWPEIRKWHRRLPEPLRVQLDIQEERLALKAAPDMGFVVRRTASKHNPEALQGIHAKHVLYLVDEASGIAEIVFEVAQGSLSTDGAIAVLMSNPTRAKGFFYDTHHRLRDRWKCRRVSSEDVPRARGHIADIEALYGKDSNKYRVRVLGEFPTKDDDTVIPLEWAEAAKNRNVTISAVWPKWGCDPARFGDDRTALVRKQGNSITHAPNVWKNLDGPQVAGRIIELYNSTPKDQRPRLICVDVIGIGASVVDHLRLPDSPVKDIIRAVNVAESASNSDKYHRLRDELWWKGREWFAGKDCCIKIDPHWSSDQKALVEELLSELTAPTYDFSVSGKIVVQSKEDMKKDGLRSPDIADAFLLTFAGGEVSRARLDVHREYDPEPIDPWAL
jgi:phage terminase large subunit